MLFFVVFVVEFLFDDDGWERLAADADAEGGAEGSIGSADECHRDGLVDGDGVVACGDYADNFVGVGSENFVAVAGDCAVKELEPDELACGTFGFLCCNGFLADKFGFVELDKHCETSLNGSDVVGEFVAVERQTHFEAQSVTAPETAGLSLTGLDETAPCSYGDIVGSVELETVLAGVAGAADDCGLVHVGDFLEGVEGKVGDVDSEDILNDFLSLRTLNGNLAVEVAEILDLDIEAGGVGLNPGDILVNVGGIDDEEETIVATLVDEQIVDHAAAGVEHHSVEALANRRAGDIVGENVVDVTLGVRTGDGNFAHVGNIENAASITHGVVLLNDTTILDGHVEAAEGTDESFEGNMLGIEACAFVIFHKRTMTGLYEVIKLT